MDDAGRPSSSAAQQHRLHLQLVLRQLDRTPRTTTPAPNPVRAAGVDPSLPITGGGRVRVAGLEPGHQHRRPTPRRPRTRSRSTRTTTSAGTTSRPRTTARPRFGFGSVHRGDLLDDRVKAAGRGGAESTGPRWPRRWPTPPSPTCAASTCLPELLRVIDSRRSPTRALAAAVAAAADLADGGRASGMETARRPPRLRATPTRSGSSTRGGRCWCRPSSSRAWATTSTPRCAGDLPDQRVAVGRRTARTGVARRHKAPFQYGWWGYVDKDIRGGARRAGAGRRCRRRTAAAAPWPPAGTILLTTLSRPRRKTAGRTVYPGDDTCSAGDQWCADSIVQRPLGGITARQDLLAEPARPTSRSSSSPHTGEHGPTARRGPVLAAPESGGGSADAARRQHHPRQFRGGRCRCAPRPAAQPRRTTAAASTFTHPAAGAGRPAPRRASASTTSSRAPPDARRAPWPATTPARAPRPAAGVVRTRVGSAVDRTEPVSSAGAHTTSHADRSPASRSHAASAQRVRAGRPPAITVAASSAPPSAGHCARARAVGQRAQRERHQPAPKSVPHRCTRPAAVRRRRPTAGPSPRAPSSSNGRGRAAPLRQVRPLEQTGPRSTPARCPASACSGSAAPRASRARRRTPPPPARHQHGVQLHRRRQELPVEQPGQLRHRHPVRLRDRLPSHERRELLCRTGPWADRPVTGFGRSSTMNRFRPAPRLMQSYSVQMYV